MKHTKFLLCISMIFINSLVYSTILVTQPAVTGFAKNQVKYWFANFGVIHYNKPMSFSLFVTNFTLCGDPSEASLKQFQAPTYVVVKEGGCSFPKKAQQAQNLGAQGIIIGSTEVQYSDGNVVLSDDGTGRKVRITTLFIKLEDVTKLGTLTNPKIKVSFQLQQTNKSTLNLFLSASGKSNYIFLRNFRTYYNKIADKVNLNIAYHTLECKSCEKTQCILENTCCAFDLDNYQSGMGAYIVEEQFWQYKIFQYFAKQNKTDQWFEYMDRFDKKCADGWLNSKQCAEQIRADLGIKQLEGINTFDTMMQWRRLEVKTGIISLPDISVNGIRHVEQLNAQNAFIMVCESLIDQPQACNKEEYINKHQNKGGIIAAIIISTIVFIGVGIFCYRKVIKREITNDMSAKVDELVAKYATKVSELKKKRKDKMMERMTEEL